MQRQPEEFALVLSLSGSGYSGPKVLWFLGGVEEAGVKRINVTV